MQIFTKFDSLHKKISLYIEQILFIMSSKNEYATVAPLRIRSVSVTLLLAEVFCVHAAAQYLTFVPRPLFDIFFGTT